VQDVLWHQPAANNMNAVYAPTLPVDISYSVDFFILAVSLFIVYSGTLATLLKHCYHFAHALTENIYLGKGLSRRQVSFALIFDSSS
jgi:hypothetical protein